MHRGECPALSRRKTIDLIRVIMKRNTRVPLSEMEILPLLRSWTLTTTAHLSSLATSHQIRVLGNCFRCGIFLAKDMSCRQQSAWTYYFVVYPPFPSVFTAFWCLVSLPSSNPKSLESGNEYWSTHMRSLPVPLCITPRRCLPFRNSKTGCSLVRYEAHSFGYTVLNNSHSFWRMWLFIVNFCAFTKHVFLFMDWTFHNFSYCRILKQEKQR